MKLALIPPFELLEYTDETGMQLMLPHLVKNETYRYVYTQHCQDPKQYVILDNGEAEGESFDNETLINMALSYGVSELVIPDTIKDKKETREKARAFQAEWERMGDGNDLKLMFVAQGTNFNEFFDSATWAAYEPWIDVIGLPRHMHETCGMDGARFEMTLELADVSSKPIHLLGATHLDSMEMCSSWPSNVRSTDTSMPFNFAYHGFKVDVLLDEVGIEARRPEGYFEMPWESFPDELVRHNVKRLMDWTGNEL